jgi:hypothetical protein
MKKKRKQKPIHPQLQTLADTFQAVEQAFADGRALLEDISDALQGQTSEAESVKLLQTLVKTLALIQSQIDEFMTFCDRISQGINFCENPKLEAAYNLALTQQRFVLEHQLLAAPTAGGEC